MVIPFTEFMFAWNELHNSILFCIGGCIIIISFILIRILSIKLKDRVILLIGLGCIFTGLIIACACLPFAKQFQNGISFSLNNTSLNGTKENYDYQFFPAFVVFVVLDVIGLPAIAICSASLFTKLINYKVQGFGQGIQRGILGIGTILGPLSAGPFIYKPIILLAITLIILFFIFILVLISFDKFVPKVSTEQNTNNKS